MGTAGDRDNFSGDKSLIAPTGGVIRGKMYAQGNIYVVARETQNATVAFMGAISDVVWATKAAATGKSFLAGGKIYYDATNHVVTPSTTGNTLIGGYAIDAAAATDVAVRIMLRQPSPTLT